MKTKFEIVVDAATTTVYEANETMSYCWRYTKGYKGTRVRISKAEFLAAKETYEQERKAVTELNRKQIEANEFTNIGAEEIKAELEKKLDGVKISIGIIGPIVGASVGPGTVAIYGFGKKVTVNG